MGGKEDNIRRFALPTKDGGIVGVPLSSKEIQLVNRLYDKYPDKFEAGAEGVLRALEELKMGDSSQN